MPFEFSQLARVSDGTELDSLNFSELNHLIYRKNHNMSISLPSTEAGPSQIRKPSQQARDPGQKGTPARVKPLPVPVEAFDDPHAKEEETVHEVYESIAPHFAQTRHKVGERFLR